jgi:hypothetical protein
MGENSPNLLTLLVSLALNTFELTVLMYVRTDLYVDDQGSMLWSQFFAIVPNFRRKNGVFS